MEDIEQTTATAEPTPVVEPQVQEAQQEEMPSEEKPRRSLRDSLEKAFKDADAAEAKARAVKEVSKPDAEPKKAEPKADDAAPARTPDGKFAKKDAEPATDKPADAPKAEKADNTKPNFDAAPARFSEKAKAAWNDAPEDVRAETLRAIRENEAGLQRYQEQMKPIQPFLQMANGDANAVANRMAGFLKLEQAIQQNPVNGLSALAQAMGFSREQVGKMLLNQDPGQPDPRDQQIAALSQQVSQMQQALTGVNQTMTEQRQQTVASQVQEFASKPEYSRFDELSDDIAFFLETGKAPDLISAYKLAERLNPAPQPEPEPAQPPAPPAQTRPARSLTGAPSTGSNPATKRTPSKTPLEALERAWRA